MEGKRLTPWQQKVVAEHLGLALACAKSIAPLWGYDRADAADLRQACFQGLCNAVIGYDSSRGVAFSTYCWAVMRNTAQQAAAQADCVTVNRGTLFQPGASQRDDVLAAYRALRCGVHGLGRFDPVPGRERDGVGIDPADLLPEIPERWAEVLALRYGDGLNLAAIGRRMGFTKERARQIHGKALARVRKLWDEAAVAA